MQQSKIRLSGLRIRNVDSAVSARSQRNGEMRKDVSGVERRGKMHVPKLKRKSSSILTRSRAF